MEYNMEFCWLPILYNHTLFAVRQQLNIMSPLDYKLSLAALNEFPYICAASSHTIFIIFPGKKENIARYWQPWLRA